MHRYTTKIYFQCKSIKFNECFVFHLESFTERDLKQNMENYSARNKDVCSSNQDYVAVWAGNLILQCILNCSKCCQNVIK